MQKKKKERLLKRKQVIDLLKEKSYRYTDLVKETKIHQKTMDRILGELFTLGLAGKKANGAWEWYLYKRSFSPIDLELMNKHSRHVIYKPRSARERDLHGIAQTSAYALLRSYDKGVLEHNFPEFTGHLKTGYPDLYTLFKEWRKLPETAKVTEAGVGFRSSEVERKTVENILSQVGGQLAVIITRVENHVPLEGHCDSCPHLHLTIKE